MTSQQDPLWDLQPPKMDMVTYLTYIEEHITKSNLNVLYEVLENSETTDSIGWDLVKILLPLLPNSNQCLLRIARLGNAKEVIMKVSEALRAIDFDQDEETDSPENGHAETNGQNPQLPLPIIQFQTLLNMLAILHRRLAVKYPSRFLSSTLQAILSIYPSIRSHYDEITSEIVHFVQLVAGPKRPSFPPRRTSSALNIPKVVVHPENIRDDRPPPPMDEPTEEDKIFKRLIQSFLTHVLDDYMQVLPPVEGISGLAWSSRYLEHIKHPLISSKQLSLTDQFSHSEDLEGRLTTVGQLVAVAQDVEIHSDDLFSSFMDSIPESEGDRAEENSYPSSAEVIPFSKSGALYLYTARKAMEVLYGGPKMSYLTIFPDHSKVLQNFAEDEGPEQLSMSAEALIDTLLFHGLVAVESNMLGEPSSTNEFNEYLQLNSVLSACLPSPTLRFQAHYLTTTVLRSHPREMVQIEFIKDTLENCPFDNLKVSAVSWIKGLTLEVAEHIKRQEPTDSLFATPAPLSTLSSELFPDLTLFYPKDMTGKTEELLDLFRSKQSFYAASLSFVVLLVESVYLHDQLKIRNIFEEGSIYEDFVSPLHSTATEFLKALESDDDLKHMAIEEPSLIPQLELLVMWCNTIIDKSKSIGWL